MCVYDNKYIQSFQRQNWEFNQIGVFFLIPEKNTRFRKLSSEHCLLWSLEEGEKCVYRIYLDIYWRKNNSLLKEKIFKKWGEQKKNSNLDLFLSSKLITWK